MFALLRSSHSRVYQGWALVILQFLQRIVEDADTVARSMQTGLTGTRVISKCRKSGNATSRFAKQCRKIRLACLRSCSGGEKLGAGGSEGVRVRCAVVRARLRLIIQVGPGSQCYFYSQKPKVPRTFFCFLPSNVHHNRVFTARGAMMFRNVGKHSTDQSHLRNVAPWTSTRLG